MSVALPFVLVVALCFGGAWWTRRESVVAVAFLTIGVISAVAGLAAVEDDRARRDCMEVHQDCRYTADGWVSTSGRVATWMADPERLSGVTPE